MATNYRTTFYFSGPLALSNLVQMRITSLLKENSDWPKYILTHEDFPLDGHAWSLCDRAGKPYCVYAFARSPFHQQFEEMTVKELSVEFERANPVRKLITNGYLLGQEWLLASSNLEHKEITRSEGEMISPEIEVWWQGILLGTVVVVYTTTTPPSSTDVSETFLRNIT